ncbi:GntR family transcriptional regulator [Thioalkalivibrio denitrificans]|uniref:GntR family transcriptional regulator n=1 Tax=Thioalkalivibrio denitrificans TaxID=108003 RepID=A0A1V3NCA0_9GAMM|nr:PLP-dependent aminotransferase family protein [Thioalkalivibrio denitrificans]OOG22644.1 GntR family transcriptional regulator [Thioalkalivibrio denitrificans]
MDPLYRKVAAEIAQHIERSVYVPGDRLPGVRRLARTRGVSTATAVSAYQTLADEGYIEARSRSGFYVRARKAIQTIEPTLSAKAAAPKLVTGQAMAMALIKAANDPAIVQLGAAVPDPAFLPTQAIARALATVMRTKRSQVSSYMMPPGALELRRQISRRMSESGAIVSVDDMVITTGCQEALSLALRAVTRPGDVVAVESPAFYGLLHVLESLGLEALEVPAHPIEGISLDALGFALERWAVKACVLVPNYSNPLGYCMSDDQKHALIRLLEKHRIPLIEDDVYGDLGFSSQRPSTCKGLAPHADILYCGSFSKSLSPGLRIGWIAAGRHHAHVEFLKYVTSIASSTAPQLAAAELLATGRYERYLREVRSKYQSAVARMSDAVMRTFPEGTRISQPRGGFVIWVELPKGTDSMALARRALRDGVSIAPGPLFSASGKFANFIRLSCAKVWDARLERALFAVAKLI